MQINPNTQYISVEQGSMLEGAGFMEETSNKIHAQCSRLEEVNEQLYTGLEGNVKICFREASSASCSKIQTANSILNELSKQIVEYTKEMTEADMQAACHGGGGARR